MADLTWILMERPHALVNSGVLDKNSDLKFHRR